MRKVVGVFLVTIIGLSLWALTPVAHVTKVPTQKIKREWVKADSLAYARDQIEVFAEKQFACLENLWGKESGWNPTAFNLVKSMGMHAGGIPQLLGMSPKATPSKQIERGLAYINYRYITPCVAWRHEQRKGWY